MLLPCAETVLKGCSLPKVTGRVNDITQTCARLLLPSTRLTPTHARLGASPASSHFVLLTTPPRHPPIHPTRLRLCFRISYYRHIVAIRNCNRSHVDRTTRPYTYLLRRAHPRDLRVTTSTTPSTSRRKSCRHPPPTIFAPDSASIGSPLLAAAHTHQHVLFRVAVGQDRPIGACLAGFQLGAQTHKAECAAVGSREQCEGYHRPGPGAHGSASEWTIIAGCGQNLQQEG